MVNLVDLDEKRLDDIVVNELEVLVADPVLHIPTPPREKIVHNNYLKIRSYI